MRGKHQSADPGNMTAARRALALMLMLGMLCVMLPSRVFAEDFGAGAPLAAGEYAPDPAPEVIPEPAPVPAPEVATEPTPEPAPEVTTDPVPEPVPEVTTDPTPEVTTDPTPEPVPEVTADPVPEPAQVLRVCTISDDAQIVTVSGLMPEGASLTVEEVEAETARALLGKTETVILFAYDIRIMADGAEYQPTAENPVTVTITPPQPIEAPTVEVVHIAEDEDTGETTPQSVATVTPTENTVEFEAEAFSVYVISVINTTPAIHTVTFPVGDFKVDYSTSASGTFTVLTLPTVSLGSSTGTQYDTLYFKVTPAKGFQVTEVKAESTALTASPQGVYALAVSGAVATTTVNITVTGVKVTGISAQGQTLTAVVSNGSSGTFTYTWQSCDTVDGAFSPIAGQTDRTFILPNSTYNGKYIRVVATDGTNEYSSAPVGPVAAENMTITFDLAYGNVEIGLSVGDKNVYRGYNSDGAFVTGTHADTNEYTVMQSDTTVATPNRIILIGNSTKPKYDVTLSGIKCDTPTNKATGGIYADATNSTPMDITLKLSGNNYVGRIHYGTSGMELLCNTSTSSLTIEAKDSTGYLEAQSTSPWSAAIGGVDERAREAARNIHIKSGTINAIGYGSGNVSNATGTCAIGGGGNGACNITISGGTVTATSNGTGATIGGGGGANTEAGEASVTITGGTVTATNNYVNGVAIGGGGSLEKIGGSAEVTISGGTVTANGSIGGGYSRDVTGGDAMVEISGGRVTVIGTGNIGGGSSPNNIGGTATVIITGGTVVTPHISGGYSGATAIYNDAALTIAGSSVNIDDSSNITSVTSAGIGQNMVVYSNVIDLSGISSIGPNKQLTYAYLTDGESYPLHDVFTDDAGKIYFWLPTEYDIVTVTPLNGSAVQVDGALVPTASILHDDNTVGTVLTAHLNTAPITTCQWQRSGDNGKTWTNIGTPDSTTYTATPGDAGSLVRVIINNDAISDGYISGSIRITGSTFVVTIPESVNMTTTHFTITGARSNLIPGQSLTVTATGGFTLSCGGQTLNYVLSTTPGGTAIISGGTVATFAGNGSSTVSVYYSVTDTPRYSGIYTDTLTFTVSFINGS